MTITKLDHSPNFPDADWHIVGDLGEPSYENSWVAYGGAFAAPAFRMDSDGWVHLRGIAKSGTMGTAIFTLPAGYRPLRDVYTVAMADANVCAYVRVIASSGAVAISSSTGTNGYVSISNVKFPAWQDYSRFDGRMQRLVNPNWEQRTGTTPEFASCIMLHSSGMGCLMGIHGATTGSTTSGIDVGDLAPHFSYVGHAVDSTSSIKRFDISSRYGIYTNASTTSWTILPSTMVPMKRGIEFDYRSPTLVNSWSSLPFNTSNRHSTLGFYKDEDGFVYLRGLATGGSAANATIFTLPAGFRPSSTLVLSSISATGTCRIDVTSAGVVYAAAGGSTGWNSLDGLCFYADQ